jgi:1-aminocyclopropane-1-carboxylate deaminase/D-cysteine desulfhydrase-like pyridoxal-dependent ACC family enzyme
MTALGSLPTSPRTRFAALPTALERADALAEALSLSRPLYVKRDDLTGPGMGGNKVRKLEYLIADARAKGADSIVTFGATQSNSARLSAVVGAMAGLEVHLVLGGETDEWEGNLLLDRLAGARIHFVPSAAWHELSDTVADVEQRLRAAGRRPYAFPMGGSTEVGALGYAAGYGELLEQLDAAGVEADWVVHASSTGGTQAGLVAGRVLHGRGPRVFGVDVIKGGPALHDTVQRLAEGAIGLYGRNDGVGSEDVVNADFTGPAYGELTAPAAAAIRAGIRTSGIVVDPVYSAKALAALPELEQRGLIPGDRPLVFLHTGGQPALFARPYRHQLMEGDER